MADEKPANEVWEVRTPYGTQDKAGNDLAHLRANLQLSPTQRVEKMIAALELSLEARRAGIIARLQKDS